MYRVQSNWVTLLSLFLVIGLSGRNSQAGFFEFSRNINGVIQKFDDKIYKYNSRVGRDILEYAKIDSEKYYGTSEVDNNIVASYIRFNQGLAQIGVGTLAEPIAAIADKYHVWVKGHDPTPNTSLIGAFPRSLGHVASGSLKVVGGLTGMVLEASKAPPIVVFFAPLAIGTPMTTLISTVRMTSAALGKYRIVPTVGEVSEIPHVEVIQTEGHAGLQHLGAVHQDVGDESLPVAEEVQDDSHSGIVCLAHSAR